MTTKTGRTEVAIEVFQINPGEENDFLKYIGHDISDVSGNGPYLSVRADKGPEVLRDSQVLT